MTTKKVIFVTGPAGCGKSANAAKLAEYFGCDVIADDCGAAEVRRLLDDSLTGLLLLGLPDDFEKLMQVPDKTEVQPLHYLDACRQAGISPFHSPDGRLLPYVADVKLPQDAVIEKVDPAASAVWVANHGADKKYEAEVAEVLGAYGHDLRVLDEIKAEREKQRARGYDFNHDDQHTEDQLVEAALAYQWAAIGNAEYGKRYWPWSLALFNAQGDRASLIKAAALLVSEIQRMDRVIASVTSGTIDDEANIDDSNNWHPWDGCGEIPVPAGTRVDIHMQYDDREVRTLYGVIPMATSDQEMDIAWKKTVNGNRIVAWRPSAVSVCEFCHGVDNDHAAGCCQGV